MPWPTNARTTWNPAACGVDLDRLADVGDRRARTHGLDAVLEALLGDLDQAA